MSGLKDRNNEKDDPRGKVETSRVTRWDIGGAEKQRTWLQKTREGENPGRILSEGQDALEMFKRDVYSSVTSTS